MTALILSLALAALTVTLVAGYVLAWTHSVMPGLSAVDDRSPAALRRDALCPRFSGLSWATAVKIPQVRFVERRGGYRATNVALLSSA